MSGGLWISSDTAIAWACRELLKGRTISHPDEIGEAGAWRLGAIIHVLRKRYGWPIITERRGPARIAYYRLGKADGPLELPMSAKRGAVASSAGDTADEAATRETEVSSHAL